MSNADQYLFGELTGDVGQWSAATGVAAPSAQTIAGWQAQNPGSSLQSQFNLETQNVGYYWSHDPSAQTGTTSAQITAMAQQDPRWSQLDSTGRQILMEMYNLRAMGYGGDLGQNTPLPVQATPPTGTLGIGAPGAPGMTSSQADAWAQLQQTLQAYGFSGQDLASLVDFAKQQITAGNSQTQVLLNLENTPQFAARFPAIIERRNAGLPPISPAEYLSLESSYEQLERAAGLPPNFASYDKLIAADVSPSEYSDRINKGYLAVSQAPPETMKAFQDYYGTTPGQLAAYFLDPTKAEPLLLQQAAAAQIGGASAVSGFGQVDQHQALKLAQQGVTYGQAQQGFQTLAQASQLYNPLPGQGQRYGFTTDNLLGAQFGSDGQTKLQLQLQADYEKGLTAQGTQVGQTSQGATGVGSVSR